MRLFLFTLFLFLNISITGFAVDFAIGVNGALGIANQRESLLNDAIPYVKFNNETGISYQIGGVICFFTDSPLRINAGLKFDYTKTTKILETGYRTAIYQHVHEVRPKYKDELEPIIHEAEVDVSTKYKEKKRGARLKLPLYLSVGLEDEGEGLQLLAGGYVSMLR